ncbi:hypothetical protein FXO38_14501 [Capsicum annuum]|uniref:60S ribosomal export protein NMD3 OB-fold domain-containing protein n=1 Tax=Capsicum annuum TaxID=4072 RepID=A0A2G2Z104_CAPAN|nr:hypothetical protein FXO37_22998 [Capsicum annuum]KAF3655830.1 hypothetical protein FXO38_14501 [Capsicum annuum]PHT75697.1 hypothetical protein T459_19219 [Capsicum annuum]
MSLLFSRHLVEHIILDIKVVPSEVNIGRSKYALADAQVACISDFGRNDIIFNVRPHLGHLLNPGIIQLGMTYILLIVMIVSWTIIKEYQPSEMASVTDGDDTSSVLLEELLADLDLKLKGLDLYAGLLTLKQINVATKNFGLDNKHEKDYNGIVQYLLNASVEVCTKSDREMESAQDKNQALKDVGVVVPTLDESFEGTIKEPFENLVSKGKTTLIKEIMPPNIPK